MRRWECRYEIFNPVHYPTHLVTKAKKAHVTLPRDQPTWCPLVHKFDPNIHYVVAQLRVLLGRIPVHYTHGAPVIFFAPAGAVKFCVKASIPAFGFFQYYTLDKVVCPYRANLFGMRHPTTEEVVQALLYATVDV